MVQILIVTHGSLGKGLYETAQLIVGEDIPDIQVFGFCLGDDAEELRKNVAEAIREASSKGEVLVLTDLMSGSPYNAVAYLHLEGQLQFEHLTGINFPLLLEILTSREYMGAKELVKQALTEGVTGSGRGSILDVNEYLDKEVS